MSALTLATLKMGQTARISSVDGPAHVKRRLMEIGLIPGVEVTAIRQALLGDPIEVQVMHYHLTLRKSQAAFVHVEETSDEPAAATEAQAIASHALDAQIERVALVGNPNCGKTSLFNRLTGLRQKVGNYPGVTIERRSGFFKHGEKDIEILDLPGTYSLNPSSPDERITTQILNAKNKQTAKPDALILVVDACNLARNLYLYTQCIDLGLPIVVALTMFDIAEKEGIQADIKELECLLGVPVVAVNNHSGEGVEALKEKLFSVRIPKDRSWEYPESIQEPCKRLGEIIRENKIDCHGLKADVLAERLLCGAKPISEYANQPLISQLEQEQQELKQQELDINEEIIRARYAWITAVCNHVLPESMRQSARQNLDKFSLKLDSLLVHKFFGLIAFNIIMASVFIAVFIIADPIMGMFEDGIAGFGDALFGGMSDGPLKDLLLNGVIAGVGGVVVFVPQIAILSLFLALLEDSGYLARASFLMDRLLSSVGLHGKSFIPLLTSHACAIPGIMAARSIEDRRDRLATILVAPFMACGARLPVYALLIAVIFHDVGPVMQGLILLSLYVLGVVAAAFTAFLAKKTALKGPSPAFIMEFPSYRMPQWMQVARIVGRNSWLFCKKAGTIILAFSICLWAMLYYPRLDQSEIDRIASDNGMSTEQVETLLPLSEDIAGIEESEASEDDKEQQIKTFLTEQKTTLAAIEKATAIDQEWAGAQSRQSIAGTAGHMLEPIIAPMGYDWKIGVGLIGAFAAREVFVATMGTVYSVGEAEAEDESLHEAMKNDKRSDGKPLWDIPVAISVLVFFAIAMQCISTLAVVKQETGTWRWPVFQLLYMNGLAYILATLVYQIGSRIS